MSPVRRGADLALRICAVFELPVEAVFSRRELGPPSARHGSGEGTRDDRERGGRG